MTDPLMAWRRRTIFMWLIAAAALALSLLWALGGKPLPPVEEFVQKMPAESQDQHTDRESVPEIDPSAFLVKLWNPPPPPPEQNPREQPVVAERATPLNLQLIGIIDHGSVESRRAAIYDPAGDTLYIVGHGERLQQHLVTEIAATYVEFETGRHVQRLHLITPGPPEPPEPAGASSDGGAGARRGS